MIRAALGIGFAVAASFGLADAKAEIEKRYASIRLAIMKKQLKPLLSHFTLDLVSIEAGGKQQNRKQYEADLARTFKSDFKVEALSIKIDKLSAVEGSQVANCTVVMRVRFPSSPQPKTIYESTMKVQDTWTRVNGVWMTKKTLTLNRKTVQIKK